MNDRTRLCAWLFVLPHHSHRCDHALGSDGGSLSLAKPKLRPSDVETLMEWEAEGGCEAACPHHCWVEPDGTCPHGHPSWLLRMGLI